MHRCLSRARIIINREVVAVLMFIAGSVVGACVVFVFVGLCAVADEDAERRHK